VRSRVRLMNEYSVAWPLWVAGGAAPDDALPVPEPLARELRAWAREFNEHYHWQDGWDDPALADAHAREAARLHRALQAELGPDFEVVLDLWEVPAP
jgi:hypothetical protein